MFTHHHDERPYSFCPLCGGERDLRTIKPTEPDRLVCRRCGFIFYQDPKVAVGTIIRDDNDEIVLVRRAIELAANLRADEFEARNPLIAIMQWWEKHVPEAEKLRATPEKTLTEACRRFLLAHRSQSRE